MQAKNERVLFLSVIKVAMQDAKEASPKSAATLEWLMQDQVDLPRICELAGVDRSGTAILIHTFGMSVRGHMINCPEPEPQAIEEPQAARE